MCLLSIYLCSLSLLVLMRYLAASELKRVNTLKNTVVKIMDKPLAIMSDLRSLSQLHEEHAKEHFLKRLLHRCARLRVHVCACALCVCPC